MALRKKSDEDGPPSVGNCQHCCNKKDQLGRHVHFLRFGDESSLAGHLMDQYGDRGQESGHVNAIVAWVLSMQQIHSDKVDNFGRPLPVWEAWVLGNGATAATVARLRQQPLLALTGQ